jgi:3-methyladenine DNA glycosylase AlkD
MKGTKARHVAVILSRLIEEIMKNANDNYAEFGAKMLNINDNGYGKGDTLVGCNVPTLHLIAKKFFHDISFDQILKLLHSEIHEVRFVSLLLMVKNFEKYDWQRKEIVDMYLSNTLYINNWDLVDVSCYKIIGSYFNENDDIFWKLSRSDSLWENRIAVVSTLHFIRNHSFDLTLKLVKHFLDHKHHLIHKSCGWMLREIGKKDQTVLIDFLRENKGKLPKIMFRYSTEKLSNEVRTTLS